MASTCSCCRPRQSCFCFHHMTNPVRAVLGSPPHSTGNAYQGAQGSEPGAKMNRLIWSLGPTMLLDDAIPSDLALVFYELGSRYTGNAQDSLGRFLTYRASAEINLRLDQIARKPTTATSNSSAVLSEKELSNLPLVTAIAGRSATWYLRIDCTLSLTLPTQRRLIDRDQARVVSPQAPLPLQIRLRGRAPESY